MNNRNGLAIDDVKVGAQGFVAGNNGIEAMFKGIHIQITMNMQCHRHIVGGRSRIKLIQQPQLLLHK